MDLDGIEAVAVGDTTRSIGRRRGVHGWCASDRQGVAALSTRRPWLVLAVRASGAAARVAHAIAPNLRFGLRRLLGRPVRVPAGKIGRKACGLTKYIMRGKAAFACGWFDRVADLYCY
jgi:hypothetical protein